MLSEIRSSRARARTSVSQVRDTRFWQVDAKGRRRERLAASAPRDSWWTREDADWAAEQARMRIAGVSSVHNLLDWRDVGTGLC